MCQPKIFCSDSINVVIKHLWETYVMERGYFTDLQKPKGFGSSGDIDNKAAVIDTSVTGQ